MLGLYIHIPFCKQKCSYCNFHFSTQLQGLDEVVEAICTELILRKHEISGSISTLYFGGGTPSILSEFQLGKIFKTIEKNYDVSTLEEITLEANPEDFNKEKVQFFKHLNINRLSIGVQSFFEEDLLLMNRLHSAKQSEYAIKLSQDLGIENLTIDLIYGSQTTTDDMWKHNLAQVQSLSIPHFSAYALTVEPKTMLQHWIQKGSCSEPSDSKQEHQFWMLKDFIQQNSFHHYEISNMAKEGFFAKHNTNYWRNQAYLGIGPSAHSFDGHALRTINIANNKVYVKNLQSKKSFQEKELLTEKERFNEYMMIGLRTMFGIDTDQIQHQFSQEIQAHFQHELHKQLANENVILVEKTVTIPHEKWFFADGIASEFFVV